MAKWGARIYGATALTNHFESIRERLGTATYVVGTPVKYSVYVEFGTSRMAAQPYLRPAVERVKRNLQDIFDNAASLGAAISDIALRIEAEAKRLCPVDTGNLRASISAERIN